jgi:hypothetical protein
VLCCVEFCYVVLSFVVLCVIVLCCVLLHLCGCKCFVETSTCTL